jgi:hypothetical protein
MRLKDLETYLNRQLPEFFQFAMVLTADDDVSQQIIQDSQYLLMAEERDELAARLKDKDGNPSDYFRFAKKFIFASIFRIARKNNLFTPPERNERIEFHAYWNLPMDQRAVLCLRHRLKLTKEEITEILNITKVEYFNLLNLARENLMKNSGGVSHVVETY